MYRRPTTTWSQDKQLVFQKVRRIADVMKTSKDDNEIEAAVSKLTPYEWTAYDFVKLMIVETMVKHDLENVARLLVAKDLEFRFYIESQSFTVLHLAAMYGAINVIERLLTFKMYKPLKYRVCILSFKHPLNGLPFDIAKRQHNFNAMALLTIY